mmetsp:Transcript_222/g.581  ORF Transcript_222/g.581 Transcript_222/m.581 type:complete len:217 (-) Transcript_222:476-1126(-)
MLTEPLNDEQERSDGLCGAHFTSKFHCADETSQKVSMVPVELFQQLILSLPQDSRRLESIWFQESPRMPFEWPEISLKGYWTFRRSHICIEGCRSSSYEMRSCVDTSGFQATDEQRARFAGSWKLTTSFFCLRSHTTVVPVFEQEARIQGSVALRFQAQHRTSDPACLLVFDGLYRSGVLGLSMFRMLTSPSWPHVAMRLGLVGWSSTQLTLPLWT